MKKKILFTITVLTIILTAYFSFAKYNGATAGSSEGRVAKYTLGITTNNVINVPITPVTPNNSQELYFELTNKDEKEKKNEVTLKYTIELENMANLPLEFKLYKYNQNTTKYDEIQLNTNVSEEIVMKADERINHKYKLDAKWKENTQSIKYDSYEYSKTIDYIKLIVNAVQVD